MRLFIRVHFTAIASKTRIVLMMTSLSPENRRQSRALDIVDSISKMNVREGAKKLSPLVVFTLRGVGGLADIQFYTEL